MFKTLKFLILLWFFFLNLPSFSQFRLNELSGNYGLSQNTINSILQDDDGYIWIATYNGINKYDGYSMQYFKYTGDASGLSSNIIIHLFKDTDGFIWAGTTGAGLNRINPATGKISSYFGNPLENNYSNNVQNIYQSASGVFFINNEIGLKLFKVDEKGTLIFEKTLHEFNGIDLKFKQVLKAKNGNHWVHTPDKKIKLHQVVIELSDTEPVIKMNPTDIEKFSFKNGYAVRFFEYPKNTLWVLSDKLELLKISLNDQLQTIERKKIDLKAGKKELLAQNYGQLEIEKDKGNHLWVAGNNLLLNFNINTDEVVYFNENKRLQEKLDNQQIQNILIDKTNILWLGTLNNGLLKMDLENKTFLNSNAFFVDSKNKDKLFSKHPIQAICEDNDGNIWLGTQGDGGIVIVKENQIKESLSNTLATVWDTNYLNKNTNLKGNFYFDEIKRLFKDSKGAIWVGSKAGLSKVFKEKSNPNYQVKHYNATKNIKTTVFAIEEDSEKNIWAGHWRMGLVKKTLDTTTNLNTDSRYTYQKDNPNSLSNNSVRALLEDSRKNMWVGTVGGLNKIEKKKGKEIRFTRYLNAPDNSQSLSNNYVLDIFEAKNKDLYIGTFGGGLNRIVFSKSDSINFIHYEKKNGLPSDVVYQIKEDLEGNIWMLHVREISKLNPITGEITYFDQQDGFNIKEFKDNAMHFTKSGVLLSGGVNGFAFFEPEKLSVNSFEPDLVLTDFKLFNKSVFPNQKIGNCIPLKAAINKTKALVLPYDLNSLEFVFSSMHFSNPQKNKYKYILEGFSEDWQYSKGDDRRFASYTNLPPGKYVFKVFGSNSIGKWSVVPKEISITINPPWYLTTWAILVFVLVAVVIVYALVKVRLKQIRLESELELESALHEKSEEINKMKLQFFTNISHELRTPLTLIIGPLYQIMSGKSTPAELKKLNSIMHKNATRLLKLINQLLDFRKVESGNLNLIVQKEDIVSFVEEVYAAFEEIAIQKEIKFVFTKGKKEIDAWFDADKVEKILYNLLSNAFKFTPSGNGIEIHIQEELIDAEVYVVITVADEGRGIAKEELESVFERFYQVKKEDSTIHIGTGLGLAYTRKLIEIHKGKIEIDSELNKGTKCSVYIPISKSKYVDAAVIEMQPQKFNFKYTKNEVEEIKVSYLESKEISEPIVYDKNTPTVLIVEDNKELRSYLLHYFSRFYKVLKAENGKEGLRIAQEKSPNIIISDLMMPVMGGIEMCTKIKTNINTSHIPVIILTAKAGLENEKEGLETGADEFVLKPFNSEILKLRVENLLRTKQVWIEKFKANTTTESWEHLENKLDQEFLEKSIDIVKKNMDNSSFTVEVFCLDIGLSRSALFKKIKSITGQSTTEFIRDIRIKKGAELLKAGKYSITEVIFMIGFSDPKYFRTCFKKQYNQTPSEFINSFRDKN